MKFESMRRSLRDLQDSLRLSPANAKVLRNRPASKCPFATLRQVSQNRDFRTASVAAYEFATRNGSSGFKETTPRTSAPRDCPPSLGWNYLPHHLQGEALWAAIREEARQDAELEPPIASFLHTSILAHGSLAKAMAFMLANKLSSRTLLGTQLMRMITAAYEDDPSILEATVADVLAVRDRDAACEKYLHCILYYKGFQAVQCHRIAHWLWENDRQTMAIAFQSRVSEVLQVDMHPAAQLGRGIMIDHATGVVIGETAVVGDNVSLLHQVTLGGSGTGRGKRHPTIGHGVLLGAGVCVLGPITVGAGTKVGAGSVVVKDLPCHCVAVGVPAKIIKENCNTEPCTDMDSVGDFILDFMI